MTIAGITFVMDDSQPTIQTTKIPYATPDLTTFDPGHIPQEAKIETPDFPTAEQLLFYSSDSHQ